MKVKDALKRIGPAKPKRVVKRVEIHEGAYFYWRLVTGYRDTFAISVAYSDLTQCRKAARLVAAQLGVEVHEW